MEFLALHKIILLVTAFCTIDSNQGYTYIPDDCQNMIVKIATKQCNLNKDDYETCYGKVKKNLHSEFTFKTNSAKVK